MREDEFGSNELNCDPPIKVASACYLNQRERERRFQGWRSGSAMLLSHLPLLSTPMRDVHTPLGGGG